MGQISIDNFPKMQPLSGGIVVVDDDDDNDDNEGVRVGGDGDVLLMWLEV